MGNNKDSPESKKLKPENPNANVQLEKSKAHIIIEIIDYIPNAVVSKNHIKKTNR